jgi:hypothetical protein
MDAIFGTIRNGRVELDAPADWPDGQRVAVLPHLDGEPVGTELPRIELPDGRVVPFNGNAEHFKLLADQMGRPIPVETTPEDKASFDRALEETNRLYGDALKRLAK